MTEPIKEFPMWRYRKGKVEETKDVVVVEETAWRSLDPDGRSLLDIDEPGDLQG